MQKITPCLWFDDQAEEAARHYIAVFSGAQRPGSSAKTSRILNVARYGEAGAEVSGMVKGTVMTVLFELDGEKFLGLNGGPLFTFSSAVSFMINCATQEEIDYFWEKLTAGGKAEQCGWLKDKHGVSWQIVPTVLGEFMEDKDARKSERVMQAVLQMKKLEIKRLQEAYEQA